VALINHMIVSEEERILALSRVQNLVTVYQKKLFTADNITKIYGEWESVAKRLRQGEKLIGDKYRELPGNLFQNAHFISLMYLYELLVALCGIYDSFFQAAFPSGEGTDRYQRAHQQIAGILLA
jgi:hypothetical protein